MSNRYAVLFSLMPGQSIVGTLNVTSPGWQGILVWVPEPITLGVLSYGSESVTLMPAGTYGFTKTVTNTSPSIMLAFIEWSLI